MIEELERYAKESKVDELFRDIMTGCFKLRPAAPVKYILEYLADAYPEESLTHARAFVDLKDGILRESIKTSVERAVENVEVKCEIVEAPLEVAAPKVVEEAPKVASKMDADAHQLAPEEAAVEDDVITEENEAAAADEENDVTEDERGEEDDAPDVDEHVEIEAVDEIEEETRALEEEETEDDVQEEIERDAEEETEDDIDVDERIESRLRALEENAEVDESALTRDEE